jgi:hypothetical protein
MKDMKQRFYMAMGAFAVLGVLAGFTLDGKMRLAVLIFLAGLALRTAIHYMARSDSEKRP